MFVAVTALVGPYLGVVRTLPSASYCALLVNNSTSSSLFPTFKPLAKNVTLLDPPPESRDGGYLPSMHV